MSSPADNIIVYRYECGPIFHPSEQFFPTNVEKQGTTKQLQHFSQEGEAAQAQVQVQVQVQVQPCKVIIIHECSTTT